MKKHKGFRFIAMIFIAATIIALLALVVMLLWNWLIPSIFIAGPAITYWQALGLMVLSKILFGGLKPPQHPYAQAKKEMWQKKFREKWDGMDPKKKNKIKDQFSSKFHKKEAEEDNNTDKTE